MSVRSRAIAGVLTLAASAAVSLTVASSAHGATLLKVAYDVNGTSLVAKPNSTVTLGPAVLRANVRPDGTFNAGLKLPPTSSSFHVLGLLPVTSTVSFVQAGRVTGALVGGTSISSTARDYLRLSDVAVAGIPTPVGAKCQTKDPVVIPASGPFSITDGGTLTGTFSIGKFGGCGLSTALINQLVPGDGNTVTLTLTNGRITG